ncbi:MAG: hypothetical protein LBF32_01600 [Streptococcaceae bacterium]|jgi:hypothetical protein|nr:hypothetical protein [Streptococcaceae bacterium]
MGIVNSDKRAQQNYCASLAQQLCISEPWGFQQEKAQICTRFFLWLALQPETERELAEFIQRWEIGRPLFFGENGVPCLADDVIPEITSQNMLTEENQSINPTSIFEIFYYARSYIGRPPISYLPSQPLVLRSDPIFERIVMELRAQLDELHNQLDKQNVLWQSELKKSHQQNEALQRQQETARQQVSAEFRRQQEDYRHMVRQQNEALQRQVAEWYRRNEDSQRQVSQLQRHQEAYERMVRRQNETLQNRSSVPPALAS